MLARQWRVLPMLGRCPSRWRSGAAVDFACGVETLNQRAEGSSLSTPRPKSLMINTKTRSSDNRVSAGVWHLDCAKSKA
jgi:hypothetical protein